MSRATDYEENTAITVITVVKNNCDWIERTILSVLNQNFTNFQYIVIDGGSNDGTMQIINSYKECIDLIISEPDNGVYDAINKGLYYAKGSLINILNSGDCYSTPEILTNVWIAYLATNSKIIYGKAVLLDKKNKILSGYRRLGNKKLGKYCYRICHQAMFYELMLHNDVGPYDCKFSVAAEHKFTLDCVYKLGIKPYFLPADVVLYRGEGLSANPKYRFEYEVADKIVIGFNEIYRIKKFLKDIANKRLWIKRIYKITT